VDRRDGRVMVVWWGSIRRGKRRRRRRDGGAGGGGGVRRKGAEAARWGWRRAKEEGGGVRRCEGGSWDASCALGSGGGTGGRRGRDGVRGKKEEPACACGLEERGGGATEEEGDAGAVRTTISFPPF
jgi:hypothetical protein